MKQLLLTKEEYSILKELTSGTIDNGGTYVTSSYIEDNLGLTMQTFNEIARNINAKLTGGAVCNIKL